MGWYEPLILSSVILTTMMTTMMTVMMMMTLMVIKYYLRGQEYIWTIQAEPRQRMELKVVDLALRDARDDDGSHAPGQ